MLRDPWDSELVGWKDSPLPANFNLLDSHTAYGFCLLKMPFSGIYFKGGIWCFMIELPRKMV